MNITGLVHLPGGSTPATIANVAVAAFDTNTNALVSSVYIDSSTGTFSLPLSTGSYRLQAFPFGHPEYAGGPTLALSVDASDIASPAGPVTLSLLAANFTGTVETPAHVPVQGATVVLLNAGSQLIDRAQTWSDGSFTLAIPLTGGPFTLRGTPAVGTPYASATPFPVSIVSGAPSPATATLTLRTPVVTGRVTRPDNSGVATTVLLLTNNTTHVAFTGATDSSGNYFLDVPPATYTLTIFVFVNNADYLAPFVDPAFVVGSTPFTRNISLVPGNVRGMLLSPNGAAGVPGFFNVFDVAANSYLPYSFQTDQQGRFAITLSGTPTPKTYQLTGAPGTNVGANATYARTTIDVIVGATTVTRNVLLTSANVRGTVFKSDGTTPAGSTFIQVRDAATGVYLNNVGSGTAFDGTYAMGLPPGTYDLTAQPPSGDTTGLVNTTLRVTVPSSGALTGVNITLQTSNVRGTVVRPDGTTPVVSSWVEVRDANDVQLPANFAFSGSDGSYALRLPTGTYKIIAHPPSGSPNTWTTGTITVVVAGSTLTGQTVQLSSANVTGVVRAAGNPIAQSYVSVMDLATNTFLSSAGAPSGSDGTFAISLANGSYRLTANPPYNNTSNFTQKSIDVTVSGPVSNLVINLGSPNVTGRVLRPDGTTPVVNAPVEVQDASTGMYVNDVHGNTTANGTFGLTLPGPGSYRLTARPPWNGVSTDAAASITIAYSSGTLTGRDITLASPNVTGTVVAPDGTTTIANSYIEVRDSAGYYIQGANASTTAAGTYGMTLPAGTYTLTARPPWNNPNGFVAGSRVVTVGGSAQIGQTITLRAANVTGHVYLPGGTTPVANAYIDVYDSNGAYVEGAFAQTPADGSFGLTLADGDYTLVAHPPYNGTANVVATRAAVHVSGTASASITLGSPTVTGRVCQPGGGCTVVPNAWVEVFDIGANQFLPELGGLARADGTFALNPPTGHQYKLVGHPSWNNPNNYVIGETATFLLATTSNQDVVLNAADVSGRVCEPGGGCTPVPNTWVEVRETSTQQFVGWGNTSATGTFGVSLPSSGSYTFIAHAPWNNTSGWVEGSHAVVYSGSTLTGEDVTLGTANVLGTVKAPDGTPIRDAYVQVQNASGNYVGIGAPSSSNGTFALRLPTNGTYTLHAFPSWNNPGNLVEGTQPLMFTGSATNVVITLGAPNVSGRVLPPTGSTGISNASVSIADHATQAWVASVPSMAGGVFNVALPAGTYDIIAYPPYPNASGYAPGRLVSVVVAGSGTLTNQDVRLSSGNVSGTVTASGGGAVANGFVQVYDSGGTPLAISAPTRADGTYRLNLANGTYQLRALPPLTGAGFSQHASLPTTVVVSNDTHSGLDLQLQP